MAGNIKGLTVEIGGDTTKLGKALENVNKKSRDLTSELGQVNRLLKMDPGNADLIAQKQQILAEAVENTRSKLDTLKEAEKQVQEQFQRGEVSQDQVRALQREIVATEQKLKGYESAAKEVADGNDKIAQSAQDAADESQELNQNLSNVAGGGLKALAGVLTAAVTGLTAAAEATRDYRMEMGKLDTAFTDSGYSSEVAVGAYREVVGVLGEYDQAVEAANHLAKLTDNEKDLAKWTGDILPGVFATFGDSLPIEGLTEAANETAKVGQVTGPLADALNWAGVSEDKFNESLAKCTTEQERQALITETLAGLYGEASAAYKETNADVIAANQANAAWLESMAQVGATVEPVITQVKTMGAELVSKLVPAIQWIVDNLPMVGVIVGGLIAALAAFKISALVASLGGIAATIGVITTALKGLFAAMLANPIGLIILAITALVAGFMYLWKNCEGFREFWINLWEKIKSATSAVVDWFKSVPERIGSAISGAIERVKRWGTNLLNVAKSAANAVLNGLYTIYVKIPAKIWSAIFGAIAKVAQWGAQMLSNAKTAASNLVASVVSFLSQLPGKVWSAIVGAVDRVRSWGTSLANTAKSAASSLVSAVVNTISSLPSKMLSIGSNLVTGLWNGISNKVGWIKSKIGGFTSSVLKSIKGFFGVHSPSTETAWIGDMLDQGLAEGMLDNIDAPVKAMQRVTGGVLDAAQNVNGVQLGSQLQSNFSGGGDGLGAKLDKILTAIERGQIITIDGDQLVGATADRFDRRLGQRRVLATRGAI